MVGVGVLLTLITIATVLAPMATVVIQYNNNLSELVLPHQVSEVLSSTIGTGQLKMPDFVNSVYNSSPRTATLLFNFTNTFDYDLSLKLISGNVECVLHNYSMGHLFLSNNVVISAGHSALIPVLLNLSEDAQSHFQTDHLGASSIDAYVMDLTFNVNDITIQLNEKVGLSNIPIGVAGAKMLIQSKINWFGLVGGAGTIALIMISLFIPWWIFKVGSGPEGGRGLVEASLSPVSTSLSGLGGDSFTVPLMWALNLTGFLTLAVGGVIMVIYSIRPLKPYSKRLLDFSFKKPLYSVAFFAVSLFALTLLINGFLGFNVPIEGSASVQIPRSFTTGASVSVLVSANLLWPFWFGVIVAGFCIAARFYHRRLTSNEASVSSQKDVVVG